MNLLLSMTSPPCRPEGCNWLAGARKKGPLLLFGRGATKNTPGPFFSVAYVTHGGRHVQPTGVQIPDSRAQRSIWSLFALRATTALESRGRNAATHASTDDRDRCSRRAHRRNGAH